MQKLFELAKEYDMLPEGKRVLCGVSGGPDSMCLLAALHFAGVDVAAAHYNHHLRGADSDGDEAFVRAFCRKHAIPFISDGCDVAAEAAARRQGLEETARQLRYAFLERAAEEVQAVRIATAHNADDNAETFLLNFVRGTGLQGLCGIPPRRGNIVRPLLTTKRSEILSFLAQREIPCRHDASNDCLDFSRNRIRHQVMPLLEKMNPRFLEHTADGIKRLREDNDFLNAQARALSRSEIKERTNSASLSCKALHRHPPAIAKRIIRQAAAYVGCGGVTAQHISAVLTMAGHSGGSEQINLPRGVVARRSYDELLFLRRPDENCFHPIELTEGLTELNGAPWSIFSRRTICEPKIQKKDETFFIKYDMIKGAVVARPRKAGDTIQLPRRDRKTVKKLFSDEKLPKWMRDCTPVLADESGVLAVAGFGPEESRLAKAGEEALEILIYKQGEENDASGH